jgi:hypothetical protein
VTIDQTFKKRNGGCAVISTHSQQKLIKALGTYMCWSSLPFQGIPLHIFACYIEPVVGKDSSDKLMRITDIIYDLLRRDPHSRILVAGDFNHLLDTARSNFGKLGLLPALDK